MFTWICPQCGREVPPSYNECPDCAAGQKAPAPAQPAAPPMQQPAPQPMPQPVPQPIPQTVQPVPLPEPALPRSFSVPLQPAPGAPGWLIGVLSAVGAIVFVLGVFWAVKYFSGTGEAAAPAQVALEKPPAAAKAEANPLQKYVEIVGIRLNEEPNKKASARFLVVNHSGAEIVDLAAEVTLLTRGAKPGEEPAGSFSFKGVSLGPYESKEVRATLDTKLRVYELPDWQFLDPQVQITSPK